MYLKLLKESEEMTKEEAIQILSTRDAHGVLCGYTSGVTEALDMAVEALKDRPTGEWVGGQEYCKHLEEKTGERYAPTGLGKLIYCNQCWQASNRHSAYCPNCGAMMRRKDSKV